MKVNDFMAVLEATVVAAGDVYAKGCYGQTLTKALLNAKRNQSKAMKVWYDTRSVQDPEKSNYEYLLTKLGYQGYDCVCAIKGILWGSRPGKCGTYKSNAVPDVTADGMFRRCTGVTSDLTKMKAGMCIWMKGHVGVVAGKDTIYETSPKTGRLVKRSVKMQSWKKVGYLPWVDYTVQGDKVDSESDSTARISSATTTSASSNARKLRVANCTALNVRKGPGMSYAVIKVLKVGTTVTGFEKSKNGWWRIGTNQWASGTYLR